MGRGNGSHVVFSDGATNYLTSYYRRTLGDSPIKVNREPRVLLDDFYKFLRPIKVGMVVCFILGTVMAACGDIRQKSTWKRKRR